MVGGPSHLETFDYKPRLKEMDGQPMPDSFTQGVTHRTITGEAIEMLCPQLEFKKWGKSGQHFSTAFPKIGEIADDMCILRSYHRANQSRSRPLTYMNTGTQISGRPSMGSWILYGLGAETQNLPGFVCLPQLAVLEPPHRLPSMAQWFSSKQIPRGSLPQQGRPRALSE